ncbi:hypothetical protein Bca101_047886 [Brassica carinata]
MEPRDNDLRNADSSLKLPRLANIFNQHARDEAGEDTATNQPAIRKCLENQTIFHKSLGEAFKIFRNRAVVGSALSAESLATLGAE